MRGCLSISQSFAKSFLETTHGWWNDGSHIDANEKKNEDDDDDDDNSKRRSIGNHYTWVNDRHVSKVMYKVYLAICSLSYLSLSQPRVRIPCMFVLTVPTRLSMVRE